MAGSSRRIQRLLHDVRRQDAGDGLEIVVRSVARAAEACGAVLWIRDRGDAEAVPSMVARWFDGPAVMCLPDPTTDAAFRTGTLALPADAGDRVLAAFPVDDVEGGAGVLTLFGDGELTADGFAAVVDFVDVLPELCTIVRERQSLDLVRRCDDILHNADVEAANQPLSHDRLSNYLSQVCAATAAVLRCQEVSIYLRDPAVAEQTFPLVATSAAKRPATPAVSHGAGPIGRSMVDGAPVAAKGLMAAPVMSGEHVWGAIACIGSDLARTDPALVTPVTPQIARYWNTWLQRRTIVEENESWRQLAAGVAEFNQLLSDQLNRRNPDDDQVFREAVDVVRRVVPDCAGGAVWQSTVTGPGDRRLTLATTAGHADRHAGRPAPAMAEWAFQTRQQRSTTDPDEIAREGTDPDAKWLIHTPLWASHRRYGVLGMYGNAATVPPNSLQICRIIGDQLGLYQHLRQTLCKLQEARATLGQTIRSQAEALEDLEHQLVSPLLAATSRTERVLRGRHFDSRTEQQLRAVRGLCRKSSRVALAAGVFAALSKGEVLRPKLELLYADDLLRILIAGADDAQLLSNPQRRIEFTVDRNTVRALGRRFIEADRSFLEQCVGNLADNAAKYSYENTQVDIGGQFEDGGFAVSVTNTGLALDPDDSERCLERNWRGTAARNATGEGSGLGLWIVDHLMRCMKGQVRVRPSNDTTNVLLTFPLS
jgi:signal transduction histidine kinase